MADPTPSRPPPAWPPPWLGRRLARLPALAVALAAVLAVASVAFAQIGIRRHDTTDGSYDNVSPFSYTHAVSSGLTNRYLMVAVMLGTTGTSISSVKWGSTSLTSVGQQDVDGPGTRTCRQALWGLVNPATGSATLQIFLSNTTTHVVSGAVTFSGVNQTTPTRTFSGTTDSSTPHTLSVTAKEGDMAFFIHCVSTSGSLDTGGPTAPYGGATLYDSANQNGSGGNAWNIAAINGATSISTTVTFGGTGAVSGLAGVGLIKTVDSAVRMESVVAHSLPAGVRLDWRTASEVNNLGYDVYREEAGRRVRVTASPIMGSGFMAGPGVQLSAGRSYSWSDDLQRTQLGGVRYWLEEIDLDGQRTWHGPVSPGPPRLLGAPSAGEQAPARLEALPPSPALQSTSALAILPDPYRRAPAYGPPTLVGADPPGERQRALAAGAALKIGVDHQGWYEIGQRELVEAGLDPLIDPRRLSLFAAGQEIPLLVRGEQDGRLDAGDSLGFLGTGLNAPATAEQVYWLSVSPGAASGRRLVPASPPPAGGPRTSRFLATAEERPRTRYLAGLRNGDGENFFGSLIARNIPATHTVSFQDAPADPATPPVLVVGLQGGSLTEHQVSVEADGTPVGTVRFSNQERAVARFPLGAALPGAGDGSLAITLRSLGPDGDSSFVDYLQLEHERLLTARDGGLRFTVAGGSVAQLQGFEAEEPVILLDLTRPEQPLLLGETNAGVDGALELAVPGQGARELLARSRRRPEAPSFVRSNRPSGWSATQAGGDLVIVGPSDLLPVIEPLRRLREEEGWMTALVDIEDVYDEMSFGVKHADALRALLDRARGAWRLRPRAVLLLGDASFDPRVHLGKPERDLLPTRLLDTAVIETASDDWFTDFDNDGIADVPVGRLPARSPEELRSLVRKVLSAPSFETAEQAAAAGPLVFITGQDGDNDFSGAAWRPHQTQRWNTLAISQSTASPGAAALELRQATAARPLLVSYLGHGSEELWPAGLLSTDSVAQLSSEGPGAFWSVYSCLTGFFHDAWKRSLSEALLAKPAGGAFGAWTSSGLTQLDDQVPMGRAFTDNLLYRGLTVGEAARQAKAVVSSVDVRRTWILFGDPTWRLVKRATWPDIAAEPAPEPVTGNPGAVPDGGGQAGASGAATSPGAPARAGGGGRGCAMGASTSSGADSGWPLLTLPLLLAVVRRRRRRAARLSCQD